MKKKRGNRNFLPSIILVVAFVGVVVFAFLAAKPYVDAEIKMEKVTSNKAEEASLIDWDYWLSINPNIVGWIVVPGTSIDYPIVQASSEDPEYYLFHDVYGEYNIYGCPYVDAECNGLKDYAPIIYGHHMINGTMFSDFSNMNDVAFADSHSIIYIHSPDEKTIALEVVGAKVINASTTEKVTGMSAIPLMRTFFTEQLGNCSMNRGEIPSDCKQVYTFVTCSYGYYQNERTLVYAV